MNIENLIGDYQTFFSDLLYRMKKTRINITGMPLSHFTYRVESTQEYDYLRDQIMLFCDEFVEPQFNGRAVSILILRNPLRLEDSFTVDLIELPAPRPAHRYPSGLESMGIVIGKSLPEFIKKHNDSIKGIKDHGIHCQPAFITYDNEKTAKFYDISLREIILLQGWKISKLVSTVHD